ncbi:MAG: DUF368 domain-containing protein [Oscillospiraceae bacterium]|nr:DUF368 domain-containing protein [Oscillospiraceae bacterium]
MSKIGLYFRFFISGLAFGIANVIPGVSGGTMLVVFGIYDKLTEAISGVKRIINNIGFLISFAAGAGFGILGFAFIITWLFSNFGVQTNMFFIGLILGSVPLIVRTATATEKIKPLCAVPFIIGLALVIGLAVAENGASTPYSLETAVNNGITSVTIHNDSTRTVEEWSIEFGDENIALDGKVTGADAVHDHSTFDKIKSIFGVKLPDMAANMFTGIDGDVIPPDSSYTFTYDGELPSEAGEMSLNLSYSMDVLFFLTMMGALFVAAVAMIIPGVSGSFVMMLLGVYSTVIAAIKDINILIIIPCAIGALLGVVLGARLVSTLIKKHGLMMYSAIMGLVIGSVYAILPVGFGFNLETGYGFVALICGILVSVIIDKVGKPAEENKLPDKTEKA